MRRRLYGHLPSLNGLRIFEAAGRHLSFTRAAAELCVTQGAVSYQIRQLEAQLGLRLFDRRIREVLLTDEGERLLRVVQRALKDISGEIRALSPSREDGILTIAVSTYVATRWLSPRLNRFFAQRPEITLRLQHSVNAPDFDMETVDLAIRWGNGDWPELESVLLLPMPMKLVCSPRLATGPDPLTLHDLRNQIFLHDEPEVDLWPIWLLQAGLAQLAPGRGPTISDPNVRIQAAIDSQGVVLADDLVAGDLAAGRLVAPFDIQLQGYGFYLLHSTAAGTRPKVRAFLDWIIAEAAA